MEKMTFADRLNLAMKEGGFTQASLAEAASMAQPSVWKLSSGKAKASRKSVQLAKALGVRAEWLTEGIGPMRETETEVPTLTRAKIKSDTYRVEVLDVQVSAGRGVMVRDEFIETIRSIEYTSDEAKLLFHGRPADNIKMIGVNGDSMSGTFEPRDQIFVDVSVDFFDGDGIYIFILDENIYIKRLQLQFDRLAIISDNKKYETWHMPKEKVPMLRILAKVLVSQSRAYKFHG